ncbi:type IV secretion system DNA-binding domain-containing protein [Chryseobacterium sp. 18068]|uniref:type IV secretion system DNA-binding domain-containing protein n=1 Tax=Chryseobacterium sp. 18068 TaxID=2681414 RepID=UPI00135BE943|nr:type IV secretion system DNA-binding domain-containing protein [Chryseobacterium sp. 18068]
MIGSPHTNKEELKKTAEMMLWLNIFVFLILSLAVYHKTIKVDLWSQLIEMLKFDNINKFYLLLFFIVLFAFSYFSYTPSKPIKKENKQILFFTAVFSFALFLLVNLVFQKQNYFSYALYVLTYLVALINAVNSKSRVLDHIKDDRKEELERSFFQDREKVETDMSVNIPYRYNYEGKERISYINICAPNRGMLVGGIAGSGKTFAVIEPVMQQLTSKGTTGLIYDFKFPTLTRIQYNYFLWYKDKFAVEPNFYFINFDDPAYSHRINPINEDLLKSETDASESAKTIMNNLNKEWIKKEGDFWVDSAITYASMAIWFLKLMNKKYNVNVCSLPHVIALSSFESTDILFDMFLEYEELKSFLKPFQDAIAKGAMQQIAGQMGSAAIALTKLASKELFYVLTDDDFKLDLNNPLSPKILCVGNNPERQETYKAPIALISTKVLKTLNQQNKLKSMVIVDEFPTINIMGINTAINTGRSNQMCVLLGFQNVSQIYAGYEKDTADDIMKSCGTRVMGQMMDEDAEKMSKSLGKQKVVRENLSINSTEVSSSLNLSMEDVVPAERFSQFQQGTVAGFFADTFDAKDPNKIFYGEVIADMEVKKRQEEHDLPMINDFTPEDFDEKFKFIYDNFFTEIEALADFIKKEDVKSINIILNQNVTVREFENYLLNSYNLDYDRFQKAAYYIKPRFILEDFFNKNLKNFKKDEKKKAEFLKSKIPDPEKFIEEYIKSNLVLNNKNERLEEHYQQIYNEIYNIVAMEFKTNNLIEKYKSNTQKMKLYKTTFSEVRGRGKINNETIKTLYDEIIEKTDEYSTSGNRSFT